MVTSDKVGYGLAIQVPGGVVSIVFEPDDWPVHESRSFGVRVALRDGLIKAARRIRDHYDTQREIENPPALAVAPSCPLPRTQFPSND